jgi:hypothetical protein
MQNHFESSKRIISVLMIFILLFQQFGCVNTYVITTDNLPAYSPKFAYEILCDKKVYIMEKIEVKNDTLSGKIFDPEWEVLSTNNFIHIYPSSDSLVTINKAKVLSIPLSGILKVKSVEKARGKSTILVLGGVCLALLILAGIAMSSMEIPLEIGGW